nr:hypothetical protein [Tanacetum cinerariifolium]
MKHTHTFPATTPATVGHLRPPPSPKNFFYELFWRTPKTLPSSRSTRSTTPHAATASKTTTTATTYNTTMAAAAVAVIFATQTPQQHQKGAFDSYKDAAGTIGAFGYVVPEQGAFGVAAAARLRLV